MLESKYMRAFVARELYYTHSSLRKGDPPHECYPCASAITIKQILLDCSDWCLTLQKYFRQFTPTIIESIKK